MVRAAVWVVDGRGLFDRCMMDGGGPRVHASDVLRFVQSPFALYCKHFADPGERDPEDPYQTLISERGIRHERRLQGEMYPEAGPAEYGSVEEGFLGCALAMARGEDVLLGHPLFYLPDGMYGIPDILERVDGASDLGPYHYEVAEIKLARNIRRYHVLQAAFYNRMIGRIQGHTPGRFQIINMDGERIPFEYADCQEDLERAVSGTREVVGGRRPPPVFGSCPYPWRGYADRLARDANDVSLVNGIGGARRDALARMGINTVDDLLLRSRNELRRIRGVGGKAADGCVLSARAISTGRAVRKSAGEPLPERGTEIFLDLEGVDPASTMDQDDPQTDYLIGALVRKDGNEEYVPFVAGDAAGEEGMLRRFLEFMKGQDDYAIYHWHHYERTHLSGMIKKYGMDGPTAGRMLSRGAMLDLHRIATRQFAFPVPGTGLKMVARWMGFEWQHSGVGALSSIILYQEYVDNPVANRDKLEMVLDYNRNDCEATAVVKDWLVRQQGRAARE